MKIGKPVLLKTLAAEIHIKLAAVKSWNTCGAIQVPREEEKVPNFTPSYKVFLLNLEQW